MKKTYYKNNEKKMLITEHLNELRHRIFTTLLAFTIITIICVIYSKNIALTLQGPASGIKFLQLAPGEYFFVSIKVSLYVGVITSIPFFIYQIILFILPGLTKEEAQYIIPISAISILLFFFGILFSYHILIPAALNFFINYGSEIVEPVWSFEEYFNFILIILLSTGITFQIPILQFILGILKITDSKNMLKYWKYITFISTIVGAIITPSTDPITQIFMSSAILILYLIGIFMLKALDK
uniref:Sec-independent protein translocase component TatC n=1 Tax=Cliftonaea pectinata TaxID=2007206 RepID=A0A1Z1MPR9_9FLOR|nr:Sec-independent protein translocase component TatC [Cliftonaea pectinata]ARW68048.1 Sec-independent protein translocase component TatC [Cliftonaea pectinata]